MKKILLTNVLIVSLLLMSFTMGYAESTIIDYGDAIPIFNDQNVDQVERDDLASKGYLNKNLVEGMKSVSLWDVVSNYHDLDSHGILECVDGYASTAVDNLDGMNQIWKISTNGLLWEGGDVHVVKTLSTVTTEGTYGTAETTVEYNFPVDNETYRLESFHKVENTETNELEWNVTEEISVKYNEWF